jgi:hypothetical protein
MDQFHRYEKLIESVIKKLELDLSGKTVLTEVGSSLFALTPIIALKAKAKKVFAWGKDTRYGKADDCIDFCKKILASFNSNTNDVEFAANVRPSEHIAEADIITNLGNVRPLDESFLKWLKQDAVIPLMCEAWEFRKSDIDLDYCKQKNIKVAGTWENHPKFKIFDACGYLAAKLCFEAGYELYQNKIAIWSNDNFGEVIYKAFQNFYPEKLILTYDTEQLNQELDFVFIADYMSMGLIIGNNGEIPLAYLKDKGVVHLSGKIDSDFCRKNKIPLYPDFDGFSKQMTHTLSHLGPKPMLDLHSAGLKVGQILHDSRESSIADLAQPMTF